MNFWDPSWSATSRKDQTTDLYSVTIFKKRPYWIVLEKPSGLKCLTPETLFTLFYYTTFVTLYRVETPEMIAEGISSPGKSESLPTSSPPLSLSSSALLSPRVRSNPSTMSAMGQQSGDGYDVPTQDYGAVPKQNRTRSAVGIPMSPVGDTTASILSVKHNTNN